MFMVFHQVMHALTFLTTSRGCGHIGAHAYSDFVFSSTPYSLHSIVGGARMSGLVAHLFTPAKLN